MDDNITAAEKKQFRCLLESYQSTGRRSRERNLPSLLYPWRNEILNALDSGARKSEIYRALVAMKVITHTQHAFEYALKHGLERWEKQRND